MSAGGGFVRWAARGLRPDRRVGLLMAIAVLLLFLALLVAVVLPVTDPGLQTSATPRARSVAAQARGERVYRSEGCWYCHTQQVRPLVADAGLGRPLTAGDYASDRPSVMGTERMGADLSHVGSRYTSTDAILRVLRGPDTVLGHTSMPSYAYLSRGDLDALARYLLALK